MKRYSIHTLLLSGLSLLCFAACSDEYMEEINSDPSKATTIDPTPSSPRPSCRPTVTWT